jgi:hypothetical protein
MPFAARHVIDTVIVPDAEWWSLDFGETTRERYLAVSAITA